MENKVEIDNNNILKYKLNDGTLIWPLVRYNVLLLSNDNNKMQKAKINKISKVKLLSYFLKSLGYIKISNKPIQIYSSVLFNIKKENKYFNVLDDFYYNEFSNDTFLYENRGSDDKLRVPRWNKDVSHILDYINLFIILCTKFFRKSSNKDNIDLFMNEVEKYIKDNEKLSYIKNLLIKLESRNCLYRKLYRLFLKITRPKIIFINCGCYGGLNGLLINEAKKLNIITAEIQHGIIGKTHIAYNYSEEICSDKEYCGYLPDYILTFGEYWSENMINPCEKVTVGYPYLNKIKYEIKKEVNIQDDTYLIISQWTITDQLITLAEELIKSSNTNIKVTYRLHPIEKLTDEQTEKLNKMQVKISNGEIDLYEEILSNKNIIGCYSTSLIEAVAFKKNIYILENNYSKESMPKEIGIWIKHGKDILNETFETSRSLQYEGEKFWQEDFGYNYKKFIKKVINL